MEEFNEYFIKNFTPVFDVTLFFYNLFYARFNFDLKDLIQILLCYIRFKIHSQMGGFPEGEDEEEPKEDDIVEWRDHLGKKDEQDAKDDYGLEDPDEEESE
jgi:hypothetical protein